jgi:hypothetical protein
MTHLLPAVEQGLCAMADVKQALRRTLGLRFKLGLFDPIEDQPYWHVSKDAVNTTVSQETNRRASRESMVLLQNGGANGAATLPFKAGKTVALIGPHAKASSALVGNYLGQLCPSGVRSYDCIQTPLEAIAARNTGGSVTYSAGSGITRAITGGIDAAVLAAKAADYGECFFIAAAPKFVLLIRIFFLQWCLPWALTRLWKVSNPEFQCKTRQSNPHNFCFAFFRRVSRPQGCRVAPAAA